MKKVLITLFVISMLAVSVGFVIAAKPDKFDSNGVEIGWETSVHSCTRIQNGTLLTSGGEVITTGYDEWGYNYQAHMFNGGYCESYRNAAWCMEWADVNLMMKWNDAWLSNVDCDGDGLLDRHYGFDSYIGSGAWLTNHQSGEYEQDGKTCKWTYFTKIVAAPGDAYAGGGIWYTADGTEIGPVIWGEFATIQSVYNDPCAGDHGIEYLGDAPTGFGFYKPKLVLVDTVEVPSDGSTVSSVSLDDGVEYLLEASGTYRFANWGDYGIADAEWAYRNDAYKDYPLPDHGWTLGEDTYPSVSGLDVLVDGGNVYWGDYNDAHTYVSPYTGNGNPVSFDIYDSAYGDNSGFITVNIYERQ